MSVITDEIAKPSPLSLLKERIQVYAAFGKLRLSALVVFSAVISYLLAVGAGGFSWVKFSALILGGFLVTASSNGFNQVTHIL